MDPVRISDTVQEYGGKRYYLCGHYFQRDGDRLHRRVWRDHHGDIPTGFHVHHVNHDKSDNRLANLALLEGSAHVAHHGEDVTPAQREARQRNVEAARRGNHNLSREIRSAAGHKSWTSRQTVAVVCERCGREYGTHFPDRARYCGNACRQAGLRARRRASRNR